MANNQPQYTHYVTSWTKDESSVVILSAWECREDAIEAAYDEALTKKHVKGKAALAKMGVDPSDDACWANAHEVLSADRFDQPQEDVQAVLLREYQDGKL